MYDHVIHDGGGAMHSGFYSSSGMHALSIAMHGGGGHGEQMSLLNMGGLHSFAIGHDHLDAVLPNQDSRRLQFKNGVPTVDKDQNPLFGYQVHVTYHGNCNLAKQFDLIRRKAGLVNIDHRANLYPAHKELESIADWNFFIPGGPAGTKPSGWYPGATGTTTFTRSYWQLAKRNRRNPYALEEDYQARTFLVVEAVSWYYFEKGVFETRFTVSVFTPSIWWPEKQRWTYQVTPFEQHQEAATYLASQVFAGLKSAPGRDLDPALGNPDPTANPDGISLEDAAVLIAEWELALKRAEEQDQQRVNDDGTERMTGLAPAPITVGDDD